MEINMVLYNYINQLNNNSVKLCVLCGLSYLLPLCAFASWRDILQYNPNKGITP